MKMSKKQANRRKKSIEADKESEKNLSPMDTGEIEDLLENRRMLLKGKTIKEIQDNKREKLK